MFEKETNEFEDGKICEIVQDGYTFHDRLLRPAMVGIAKNEDKIKEGKSWIFFNLSIFGKYKVFVLKMT